MTINLSNRGSFDEAISTIACTTNKEISSNYAFYLYLIAQCRLVFTEDLQACAAVRFNNYNYELSINPAMFDALPVIQRVGVLKHEMLHILLGHTFRFDRKANPHIDHEIANIAADAAINQLIDRSHLPPDGVFVDEVEKALGITLPRMASAEEYYSILIQHSDKLKQMFPSCDCCCGTDSHEGWESNGEGSDESLAKSRAKSMADNAALNTQKCRGNLPNELSHWLELLSDSAQLDWRKLLRRVVGNRKANVTTTYYKPNRRQPNQSHIKGRKKDTTFDLLVVLDVSGSMSDLELKYGLVEIQGICKKLGTTVKMIQVDTKAYPPEDITAHIRSITRKAAGGTILHPALAMAEEYNVKYNAVIVITDGYLSADDVLKFELLNKPVIWVLTQSTASSQFDKGRMVSAKLTLD